MYNKMSYPTQVRGLKHPYVGKHNSDKQIGTPLVTVMLVTIY
jgi:hypothetical protein